MIINIIDYVGQLPEHKTKKYKRRTFASIEYIAIHHSGTTVGNPRSFAKYHVEKNKWPGIGYHYVIDKMGHLYQTQRLDKVCYNVANLNSKVIGICVIGNYDSDYVSDPVKNTLMAITKLLQDIVGKHLQVKGHKELQRNRTCPGEDLYRFVKRELVPIFNKKHNDEQD